MAARGWSIGSHRVGTGSGSVQWSGTVQWGSVQYSTVQWGSVQYSGVQYSTVQWGPVLYSGVRYCTVGPVLYSGSGTGAQYPVQAPSTRHQYHHPVPQYPIPVTRCTDPLFATGPRPLVNEAGPGMSTLPERVTNRARVSGCRDINGYGRYGTRDWGYG